MALRNIHAIISSDICEVSSQPFDSFPLYNYISFSIRGSGRINNIDGIYRFGEKENECISFSIHKGDKQGDLSSKVLKHTASWESDKYDSIISEFRLKENMGDQNKQILIDTYSVLSTAHLILIELSKNQEFSKVNPFPFKLQIDKMPFLMKLGSIICQNPMAKKYCIIVNKLFDEWRGGLNNNMLTTNENYLIDQLRFIQRTNEVYGSIADEMKISYRDVIESINKKDFAINSILSARVAEAGEVELKKRIPAIIGKISSAVIEDFKNRFHLYYGEVFKGFEDTMIDNSDRIVKKSLEIIEVESKNKIMEMTQLLEKIKVIHDDMNETLKELKGLPERIRKIEGKKKHKIPEQEVTETK